MSRRRVHRAWRLLLPCLALAAAAPLPAQVVIYRCTDRDGNVTLQNDVACPAGMRQERQSVDVPPALPAYVPREVRMPEVVAAEEALRGDRVEDAIPAPVPPAARKPPPPLYQCSTWDQVQYLTDRQEPPSRCAPLQVVGIAGRQPAASACEHVADTCTPVPEEALCRGWQRYVEEAEFRWKFAGAADDGARRLAYERLRATFENTTCKR